MYVLKYVQNTGFDKQVFPQQRKVPVCPGLGCKLSIVKPKIMRGLFASEVNRKVMLVGG